MKLFGALASLLFALAPAVVESHGTEVRYCITTALKLRIFIEHWHNDLSVNTEAGQMTLTGSGGYSDTIYPTGIFNNVYPQDVYKEGCREPEAPVVQTCTSYYTNGKSQNDWAYFDFEMTCGQQVSYTLLSGTTYVLMEGCDNLYPATISGEFSCSNPPTTSPAPSDSPTDQPSSHAPTVTASSQPTSAPTDVPSTSPSMEPSSSYDNNIGPATNGTYLEESWSMSEPDITYNKDGNWYRLNWTVVGWKDAFETNKHINEDFYDDQCKNDGDHTEYRIESGIVNYPNTGKPEAYKDNWGNIILDFEIRPEILTTQSEIYKDNLDGSGQLDFCVRSSIGYNGTDNQALSIDEQREAGYREINFIESLLTIVYNLTSNYTTVSATVRPKDRVGTTETEDNYSLVAWICDTTTSVTDPATNFVRSYPGQKYQTFEQGSIIPVCIRPDTAAYEEGIVMRDVQSFTWTRDSISQPAIVSGTQAANRLTFYGSCDGNHYCLLSSILFADFYATAGIASGDGAARVKFEGSTRRLAEENRLLQEDSSPFDINVALAESEDGPILAKTAGGASLGFTALVSFIALSAGLLLA